MSHSEVDRSIRLDRCSDFAVILTGLLQGDYDICVCTHIMNACIGLSNTYIYL